jgi:hypothetical protein
MANTFSDSRRLQRRMARPQMTSLLLLLTACSASPVSIGSGLDSQESALMDDASNDAEQNGTDIDCSDNPLLPGCPTADGSEDCSVNPLLPGCPTAGGSEDCSVNPLLPGCPTADGSEDCAVNPLLPGCPTADE